MGKPQKKIRHNLLLAGLEDSNSEIMDEKPTHPLIKLFRSLLSITFIIAITYLILNH